MTPVESLLSKLSGVKKTAKGWSARCPAHEDRKASLSISAGGDGAALVKCHAGCDTSAILSAIGLKLSDLFAPKAGVTATKNGKPTTTVRKFGTASEAIAELERKHGKRPAMWTYHSAAGEPVGVVVRWDKPGCKEIRPVSRHGDGWRIGAIPDPRPLYGLPGLATAKLVIICEGEKAADAARALGFVATTSSGGSQAATKTDWRPLAGKEVWVLPDNDAPGRKYADTVAGILSKLTPAPMVRIVELPDLPDKGDVVDWIESHGEAAEPAAMQAEIEALANAVEPWRPDDAEPPAKCRLPISSIGQLIEEHPTMRPPIIDGILRKGETANFISSSKVGKSWFAYSLLLAVTTGERWFHFRTTRGRVLLIDNELHPETVANRIKRVAESMGIPIDSIEDRFDVVCLRGGLLSLPELRIELEKLEPGRYDLIVVDSQYRTMPAGFSENDNAGMTEIYNLIDSIAAKIGAAFVMIHHASKGNQSEKSVTDVGSGAGAQSRAVDTHVVLRPHSEDNVVVMEAAVRSFAPVEPYCLRWEYPLWRLEPDLDPADLRNPQSKVRQAREAEKVRKRLEQEAEHCRRLLEQVDIAAKSPEPVSLAKLKKLANLNTKQLEAALLRLGDTVERIETEIAIGSGAKRKADTLRRRTRSNHRDHRDFFRTNPDGPDGGTIGICAPLGAQSSPDGLSVPMADEKKQNPDGHGQSAEESAVAHSANGKTGGSWWVL